MPAGGCDEAVLLGCCTGSGVVAEEGVGLTDDLPEPDDDPEPPPELAGGEGAAGGGGEGAGGDGAGAFTVIVPDPFKQPLDGHVP